MLRTRRLSTAAITAALTVTLAVPVLQLASAPDAGAVTRMQAMRAGATYAANRGYVIGIAVLDTATGKFYGSGYYNQVFASESLIKVFIATRLLVSGRMHGVTSARAYKMITQSDDAIASSLYGSVGGDGLINWIKAYFHEPDLGLPPARPGWWGSTRLRPDGLVRLYAKLKRSPRVRPWLLNAMHHATHYGSDGTYQWFGIPSATSGAAIKQGWGNDWGNNPFTSDFNTTGFVDHDRYAVAILARGPGSAYGRGISNLLTAVARRVLPSGAFPDDWPTITRLSTRSGPTASGNRVGIWGTDFTHITSVYFGGRTATRLHVMSRWQVWVTPPAYPRNWVNVRVITDHGWTPFVAADRYLFENPPMITSVSPRTGGVAGGQRVSIRGAVFTAMRQVLFGTTPARFTRVTRHLLTAVAPAHAAGPVDIRVVTDYGTSAVVAGDRYTYAPPPPTTHLSPRAGPAKPHRKVDQRRVGGVSGRKSAVIKRQGLPER